jgi:hypothetical protein
MEALIAGYVICAVWLVLYGINCHVLVRRRLDTVDPHALSFYRRYYGRDVDTE